MAVVWSHELFRGRSRQTTFGDVPVYTRIFQVKTDGVNDDLQTISAAPNIGWLAAHPEDSSALLVESNIQQDGDSPFFYKCTFTYKTATDVLPVNPVQRPDQFSFSGSLTSAPAFWHYPFANDNSSTAIIINTAGDPLQGLSRDEGEFSVTITGNRDSFSYVHAQMYVGAVNSDTWSGGAPRTWKCQSISGNRKIEGVSGSMYVYWEVNTTLAYRGSGWNLQTWDVGFNEVTGGVRRKIMAGSDPVSEPAALSNGVAKTPGVAPDMLTFRVYPERPYSGIFPTLPGT
jgi:hypothetical protein